MPALFDSGFCVRTPSWHREEKLLADYPGSWEIARKEAGLDWDPIAEPVYAVSGIDEQGNPTYEEIPEFKRVARSDTASTLTVNRRSCEIIDHRVMGEIVEAVLETPNVKWDTAGSVDGGRKVYVCVYLDEPIHLPGDPSAIFPYMPLLNDHTGKAACKLLTTTVRVVCANTYAAAEAEGERSGTVFAFRHTAGWRERIDEARTAIRGVRRETAKFVELANELLGMPVGEVERKRFVTEFIPMPPEGVISDRVVDNIGTARSKLTSLFDSETVQPVADTAYGLVQAAGEYLDHLRSYRNSGTYLGRQLLRPEPLKTRAFKLAKDVANDRVKVSV